MTVLSADHCAELDRAERRQPWSETGRERRVCLAEDPLHGGEGRYEGGGRDTRGQAGLVGRGQGQEEQGGRRLLLDPRARGVDRRPPDGLGCARPGGKMHSSRMGIPVDRCSFAFVGLARDASV